MTATTPTCDKLVLYTTELTDLNVGSVIELNLTHKFNCGASSVLTLTDYPTIITSDAEGTSFEIDVTDYYNDPTATKYCEGIYYFEVEVTYTQELNSVTFTDSVCAFLDCQNIIKCKVKDYVLSTMDVRPYYMLDSMAYATDCDVCTCDNMCNMYNDLLATINYTIDGTTTGCGCS